MNSSQNKGLSPSRIALSFDGFDSISWHSLWFSSDSSFTVFRVFFFGFPTFSTWASLKRLNWLIDWLIDYLRFYVPLKNISLIWRRHHCRWRPAKFRPMLGAKGLWAGRDLHRATPTVTRDLGFSGLIRRTAPFSRLLRHTRGCGGSILTRILTGRRDLSSRNAHLVHQNW
jgi:hypothetical protein